MPRIVGWRALGIAGGMTESRTPGAGMVDPNVREAAVHLDAGGVRVKARPELGERIRVFTRRAMSSDVKGQPTGAPTDTVVIEIATDPDHPERFVRLYLGREVLLSTEDEHG